MPAGRTEQANQHRKWVHLAMMIRRLADSSGLYASWIFDRAADAAFEAALAGPTR